ncbi:MAG: hypothetical protein CVV27_16710, partial [Candidatus Melainabacteria bacterium HGW-Melainabacteria-1]
MKIQSIFLATLMTVSLAGAAMAQTPSLPDETRLRQQATQRSQDPAAQLQLANHLLEGLRR